MGWTTHLCETLFNVIHFNKTLAAAATALEMTTALNQGLSDTMSTKTNIIRFKILWFIAGVPNKLLNHCESAFCLATMVTCILLALRDISAVGILPFLVLIKWWWVNICNVVLHSSGMGKWEIPNSKLGNCNWTATEVVFISRELWILDAGLARFCSRSLRTDNARNKSMYFFT